MDTVRRAIANIIRRAAKEDSEEFFRCGIYCYDHLSLIFLRGKIMDMLHEEHITNLSIRSNNHTFVLTNTCTGAVIRLTVFNPNAIYSTRYTHVLYDRHINEDDANYLIKSRCTLSPGLCFKMNLKDGWYD